MFMIKENDPLSAAVTCEWELKVCRDNWQTRLESFSEMTNDETTFYLTNTLVAFENDKEVYRKTWKTDIPRYFI